MGHFHHHGGFEHVLAHGSWAIIRRQQRKHWAKTFTTSLGQVHHLLLKKVWTFFQLYPQPIFDVFHAAKNMFVEGVIAQINARADGGIATVLTNYGTIVHAVSTFSHTDRTAPNQQICRIGPNEFIQLTL